MHFMRSAHCRIVHDDNQPETAQINTLTAALAPMTLLAEPAGHCISLHCSDPPADHLKNKQCNSPIQCGTMGRHVIYIISENTHFPAVHMLQLPFGVDALLADAEPSVHFVTLHEELPASANFPAGHRVH